MSKKEIDKIYTISKDPKDVKFVNYLCKFSYVGVFIVGIIIFFDDSISKDFSNWMIVLGFGLLIYILGWLHGKFAYCIVINRENRKVEFHMLRNKLPVVTTLDAIKKVHVNLYVTFFFEDKRVMYNDARNKLFIEVLENLTEVTLGFCGRLLPRLGIKD